MDKGDEPLHDGDDDIEEDEEYLQQAERFEARYNHRFEVGLHATQLSIPHILQLGTSSGGSCCCFRWCQAPMLSG